MFWDIVGCFFVMPGLLGILAYCVYVCAKESKARIAKDKTVMECCREFRAYL